VKTAAENAKQQLAELKTEISKREAEVRSLGGEIQKSTAALQALDASVKAQSKKVDAVAQQVKTVTTEKNVQTIRDANPLFGERYAMADGVGALDPSKKTAQEIYVFYLLSLRVECKQPVDAKNAGEVLGYLKERYTVFIKPIILLASTGQREIGIPVRFDENSCTLAQPSQSPPCILYFRQNLQKTAIDIRNIVRTAQTIPDDRIKFADPVKIPNLVKELLEKSGIDVIVVLGG
jgi:hypothetical protein